MDWISLFIASTFFSGFLPLFISKRFTGGAGTVGSIVGLLIQIAVLYYGGSFYLMLSMAIASLVLGVVTMDRAERLILQKWGTQKKHTGETVQHDFNQTNIDELHGQFVAGLIVFCFPELGFRLQVFALIASMVIFRIFDVLKPGPIQWVEDNVAGPLGVMLDDTLAGAFAAAITWAIIYPR